MNKKNFKTLAEHQRKIFNIEKDSPLYDGWQLGIHFASDMLAEEIEGEARYHDSYNDGKRDIADELLAQLKDK